MQDKTECKWKIMIYTLRKSGKSQKLFCSEQGLAFSTFQYWIKKIKEQNQKDNQVKDLVCLTFSERQRHDSVAIVLEVQKGYRLIIPSRFDNESLKQILAVIE